MQRGSAGPIAVFDSGVGGLSVLGEIRSMLGSESLLYLADQGFGPYGDRSLDEVRIRVESVARFLVAREAKAVVIACNSASAAALHHVRRLHPGVPFVGMEPAVKPAALHTTSGVIGVMATEATFQGELFASVVDRHANGVEVVAQVCSGLAAAIEADGPDVDRLLEQYLAPIMDRGADHVVLGCTHYALVADRIEAIVGAAVRVVDPAPAVARQVRRVLVEDHLLAVAGDGTTTYLTTGEGVAFEQQLERVVGTREKTSEVEV
jgi:glutamate racemase